MEQEKTAKRIVSKAEYAKVQAKRVQKSILATLAIVIGLFSTCTAMLAAFILIFLAQTIDMFAGFIACVAFGCASLKLGISMKKRIESETVDIVPLTRTNIADIPAPESLVRASYEPMQAQQSILLRAATEVQATSVEELLRPSDGKT